MNLQDAASLTIPEGGVRNIRDGNGNLLWSSVGYNVRYDGDIYQQTYSGANLFNYTDTNNVGTVTTVSEDGFITQSKDNSSGTGLAYNNYFTHNLALDTSTTYTVVAEVQAVNGTGTLVVAGNHATAQSTIQLEYLFSDLRAGDIIVGQFKTRSSFSGDNGLRGYTRYGAGESGSITYRISVLADTSVTPETFVYQPYTGGIPSPNPGYPQPIQVVTGVQTVTISDGVDSEDYTLDFGSTELCKIGTYQDYIYNSGDDWYVHKACEKYIFTGDEPWALRNTTAEGVSTFSWSFADMPVYAHVDAAVNASKCSYLSNHGRVTNVNQMYYSFIGFAFYNRTDAPNSSSFYANTKDADLTTFKLGVTGKSLYYPLATPIDTKITDATLISQLNAIHNWLIRHDYSGTVSGNLPIIINRTGLI